MNVFEHIKNSITFEEVAKDHGIEFNPNGKALCQFHEEKVPSFSLHPSGWFAKCFGCGVVADVIELEYRLGHHNSRWDAAKVLNDRYHLGLKFDGFNKEKAEDINSALELLDWYCNRTHEVLLENEDAFSWLETQKGLTLEDIKHYRIGYVGHGWVKNELEGAKRELALKLGLLKERDGEIYDALRNRITFPVWSRGRIGSIRKHMD